MVDDVELGPAGPNRPAVAARSFLDDIWRAARGPDGATALVTFVGEGALPSVFAVTDLAAASIAAVALAVACLPGGRSPSRPAPVIVDRRLASFWFGFSLKPDGWTLPPVWDPIAGDYRAADGWIRLHTNAPHHRAAALAVLGVSAEKEAARAAVGRWRAETLETAIVAQGGCAAAMRPAAEWARHAQGNATAAEPLIWWRTHEAAAPVVRAVDPARPLAGVRVLDLTRVLAGPVATRCLAGFGAEVLRIDPPDWDEPSLAPDVTLGKRCARLDLRRQDGRERLLELVQDADILVHGYRPGAMERLGLGEGVRRLRPGLVDVSLDAYGWTGPWAGRRGFDSLVQMSTGIAEAGMRRFGKDRPTPLPVQALDHATGYMMAAAAVTGLARRRLDGAGSTVLVSLARMADLLIQAGPEGPVRPLAEQCQSDFQAEHEATAWGPGFRLKPPIAIDGTPMSWERAATQLGSSPPVWQA
jgi:CoA-transferase family III